MSNAPVLGQNAIALLITALESPRPIISAATLEQYASSRAGLQDLGLIRSDGYDTVIADREDRPVELVWNGKEFGYYDGADGWISVPNSAIERFAVNMAKFATIVTARFDLSPRGKLQAIVDGHLWELGAARFGTRLRRNPVLFGRRLYDAEIWKKVTAILHRRPSDERRLLLTTTDPAALPQSPHGCLLVSITDVLTSPDDLAVDAGLVSLRINQESSVAGQNLVILADGREVRFFGKVFKFPKGVKQRQIIAYLQKKYLAGDRWVSSAEVADVCELGLTSRVRDVFKGHPAWGHLLIERDGMCGFVWPSTSPEAQ